MGAFVDVTPNTATPNRNCTASRALPLAPLHGLPLTGPKNRGQTKKLLQPARNAAPSGGCKP